MWREALGAAAATADKMARLGCSFLYVVYRLGFLPHRSVSVSPFSHFVYPLGLLSVLFLLSFFSWYLILSSSSPYSVSRRPKEEPRPCIYRTAQSAVHRVSNSRLPLTRPALWRSNLFETAFFFFFFFLLFILNFI